MVHGQVVAQVHHAAALVHEEEADVASRGLGRQLAQDVAQANSLFDPQPGLRDEGHRKVGQRGTVGLCVEVAQEDEEDAAQCEEDRQRQEREGPRHAAAQRPHTGRSRGGGTSR